MEYDIGVDLIEDDDTQLQLVRDLMQLRKVKKCEKISGDFQ